MTGFTPGPWEARRDRVHVAGKGVVATANNPWNNEREREANATLIASAPDLLEVTGFVCLCAVCAKTWALPLPTKPKSVI